MRINWLIIFFVMVLLLAACIKDSVISENGSGVKASFFASVSKTITKSPIESGENLADGGKVGVFALTYSGSDLSTIVWPDASSVYQIYNLEGAVSAGVPNTLLTSSDYYYPGRQKVVFYSYYPKTAIPPVFISGSAPVIEVDVPVSPASQSDYLWATPVTGTSLAPAIRFIYNHALSLIRIKIQKTCTEELILKAIVISTAQKQKATMNVATGEMTTSNLSGGKNEFYLSDLLSTIPLRGNAYAPLELTNGKFLFIPGTIITSIKVVIRISGEFVDREYMVPSPALSLSKGAAINILLNISKIGAVIANWDEIYETGTIGEVPYANSYIVAPNNSLIINIGIKGNGNRNSLAGTGLSISHIAASLAVLLQTVDGLVTYTDFDPVNQTAKVNTPLENALTFMDRDMGATDNTSGKVGIIEPFLYGAKISAIKTTAAVQNNLANSIYNPITFYCGIDNIKNA